MTLVVVRCASAYYIEANKKLGPFQAVCEISDILTSKPRLVSGNPIPVPSQIRIKIADVINNVNWPALGDKCHGKVNPTLAAFAKQLDSYEPVLARKYKSHHNVFSAFLASLSLVLAAWDESKMRNQVSDWAMCVRCNDTSAHLLQGNYYKKHPLDSPTTISDNWPWRKSKTLYELRPIIVSIIAVSGVGTSEEILEQWNDNSRSPVPGPH